MCSKLTMKRPGRRQWCLYFWLIVNCTYSSVFIVNFEHNSYLDRREKCPNTCFMLEKRKKSKFNRLQIEVFFLPNISPPVYKPPTPPPSPLEYRSNLYFVSKYDLVVLRHCIRHCICWGFSLCVNKKKMLLII